MCEPCLTDAATDPQRAAARLAWARRVLDRPTLQLERASSDAGFRSYWRGDATHGRGVIVMDSPPALEDVRPWLEKHALLSHGGVRVPRIDACDPAHGFVLLEDLGPATYLDVLQPQNLSNLFDAAFDQLIRLQRIADLAGIRRYDDALYERDYRLFDEWFLGRHLGLDADCDVLDRMELIHRRLIDAGKAQAHVLVHRDFTARNLMPAEGGPAVLDFQDAVVGPIAYDPISLVRDAFQSWPEATVHTALAGYHGMARAAALPVPPLERFLHDCDWIGVQRHLKILGIFARLHHRDGKSRYLVDAPRFVRYVLDVAARHDALAPLRDVFEEHVVTRIPPLCAP